MAQDSQEVAFRDALVDAEALYEQYLESARLGDLGFLACGWHDEELVSTPSGELLDLTRIGH